MSLPTDTANSTNPCAGKHTTETRTVQRIVDAVLDAAIVAVAVAIVFAFGIVAAALKVWRTLKQTQTPS